MSKDEAWEEIKGAFMTRCGEFCGWNCKCEETLKQVKEALYV
jgi:hypothetical protein